MTLIVPTRRGFVTGLASLIAAPAIVRASSLMPVKVVSAAGIITLEEYAEKVIAPMQRVMTLLTLNQITRESVRLFYNNNQQLIALGAPYDKEF